MNFGLWHEGSLPSSFELSVACLSQMLLPRWYYTDGQVTNYTQLILTYPNGY